MSELNMMPLYTDAYLADTTHLTLEEHGAYCKLLITMWRNGGWLPSADEKVARFLGVSIKKWQKLKPVLQDFFHHDGDTFTQKKLQKIFAANKQRAEKNADNGSKGGKAKALKNNSSGLANATKSPPISPPQNCSEALPYRNRNHIEEEILSSSEQEAARTDDEEKTPEKVFLEDLPAIPDAKKPSLPASVSPPSGYEKPQTYHQTQAQPRFNEVWEYITSRLPHLKRQSASEINRWLAEGLNPETEIYPSVDHSISVKGADIGSFAYLSRSIDTIIATKKEREEQHQRMLKKYAESNPV